MNIKHSLSMTSLRRQDAGDYQIEMSNYIETTRSGKIRVDVECAKCQDCVEHSHADIDTKGVDQGCVCDDGFYVSTVDENGAAFTNKLPFGCNRCPEGGVCVGSPALAAVMR
jgi:hypothetical protein